MACSLILTGLVQLAFTASSPDRLFEKQGIMVLPNLHGPAAGVLLVAPCWARLALFVVFPGKGCCTGC